MTFDKSELETIRDSLYRTGVAGPLLEAVETEIEKLELEAVDFDEDDGCAGGACKL